MKNTIITLASVAALAGATNAQTSTNGDNVIYSSLNDYQNNINRTVDPNVSGPTNQGILANADGFYSVVGSGNLVKLNYDASGLVALDSVIGAYALSGGIRGVASTDSAHFWAIANGLVGGHANGDLLFYSTLNDFRNDTNGVLANNGITFSGAQGIFATDTALYGVSGTGNLSSIGFNSATGITTGLAGVNSLGAFAFSGEFRQGSLASANNARFWSVSNGTAVPEPSSTALLGLAGLALILRRKK